MISGCILLFLLLFSLGFSLYAYRTAFYSPKKGRKDYFIMPKGEQYAAIKEQMDSLMHELEEIPCETVSIKSYDGTQLFARYYHTCDGAPLQIQFHGYRGSALRDFCGGTKLARDLGQNILLVDQRAHGKSGGTTICYGIRERLDCLCWVNYACERFGNDTKIILSGVSMGGATVLMASELILPENVCAIIADSPYSSPEAIIRKVCGDMGLPHKIAFPFVRLGAFLYARLRIKGGAEEAVKNTKTPILIIHGEDDRFVPIEMSRDIFAACASEKRLETFPEAGHGLSYLTDKERYTRITEEFLADCGVSLLSNISK